MRDGGRALHERRQLVAGTPERPLVQQLPAREHECDDEPGGELAQGERTRHREQRDHVGPQLAAEHPPSHGEGQRHDHRHQGDRPEHVRRVLRPREQQHHADGKRRRNGNRNEETTHTLMVLNDGRARIGASHRADA